MQRSNTNKRPLENILLAASMAFGLAHAWIGRYSMNPDGMSYLDLGDALVRRDWAHALNAYWSPLYAWTLGLVVGELQPSPRWEFPLVHVVNFGIFAGALFCFRFFLNEVLRFCGERGASDADGRVAVPEWALLLLGYSTFLWASLELVTIYDVSPDQAVMACLFLVAGTMLRLRRESSLLNFAFFGLLLGVGYWTKAILFPLGMVTLGLGLFVAPSIAKLASRRGGGGFGVYGGVGAADACVVDTKRPAHLWRFGKIELRLGRIAANILEKLAGRDSGKRNARASHAPADARSAGIRVWQSSARHVPALG